MYKVVFEFKDEYSCGEIIRRECTVDKIEDVEKIYSLSKCPYSKIISVNEIGNHK